MANRRGKNGNNDKLYFLPKSLQTVTAAMKLRHLLLGRKYMTNLDSVLKGRDIILPTKVHLVMCGCESWTIKKVEHRRIAVFELWYWRLLRVPWTGRRSNQSIIKESNLEYSLKGLMLKLKLQYFGHLMRRVDSLEKTPMLGKIEGRRWRGWQRMTCLDRITYSMDMSVGVVHRQTKSWTWLSDWTTIYYDEVRFTSEIKKSGSIIRKSIIVTHHTNKWRKETIITIDAEKTFDKVQYYFVIGKKKVRKLGIARTSSM